MSSLSSETFFLVRGTQRASTRVHPLVLPVSDGMVSVFARAGTALQSAVLSLDLSGSSRHRHFVVFFLWPASDGVVSIYLTIARHGPRTARDHAPTRLSLLCGPCGLLAHSTRKEAPLDPESLILNPPTHRVPHIFPVVVSACHDERPFSRVCNKTKNVFDFFSSPLAPRVTTLANCAVAQERSKRVQRDKNDKLL